MTDQPPSPSRAELDQLHNERQQLQTLLRALPDISFVLDGNGRYLKVIGGSNDTIYSDGKALEGMTLHEALPPEVADHFLALVRETLRTGELQTVEYPLRVADVEALPPEERESERGRTDQWFEGRVLPLAGYAHDQPTVLWVAVNITRRKNLEDELRRLATTDPLTDLPNRQHLLDRAADELSRARRYGHPLSLLMIDVDHFKQVNDTYGHSVGDRVLQTVARTCLEELRDTDHLGRVGGEEFVAILPETAMPGARTLGERLVAAVAALPLAPGPTVTISVGAAELSPGDDLDNLMIRADQCLYLAKAQGRNRLVTGAGD